MSKEYLFDAIRALTGHNSRVSAERIYCEAMGDDLAGGMFLSQLIFWSDKGKRADGYFYKTGIEWQEETYLSPYLVRKHTKQCEEFGWLTTKIIRANGSPTVHFLVDSDKFSKWIVKILINGKSKFSQSLTDLTTTPTTERETPSPTAKSKSLTSEETTKTPPPVPFHPPLAVTAHELTQRRGKSLKHCQEYNWQIHRPTFEAIVDAMGKQALVNADNDRTIGDLQQAAVTLTKAGVSAETIIKRTGEWKASWIGQRNGSASQFIEFMGTASAVTASGQKGSMSRKIQVLA
jgi:hypothetical protein